MNGRELAVAIASATRGQTHTLPCASEWPSFGIAIAPAGCAVLVCDHGHRITVSVGKRVWSVTPDQAMPTDVPEQARRWAAAHASETTLVDAALALAPVLERELGERWVLSIPGGQPAPTEMWLHPLGDAARASVGIFGASIRVGDAVVPMPAARRLSRMCLDVVQHVRGQLKAYERNGALSEACKRVTSELASRLGKSWRVDGAQTASYLSSITTVIEDGTQTVVRVEARDGTLVVHAGLPEADGWDGTADQAASDFDAVARAVHALTGLVTYDTLVYNQRYRVLRSFKGLKPGEVVTYGGPIDNHAPHSFKHEAGGEVLIEEHDLRANAHRILAPA